MDRMRFGWRFWIDFPRFYCDSTRLFVSRCGTGPRFWASCVVRFAILCCWGQNKWEKRMLDINNVVALSGIDRETKCSLFNSLLVWRKRKRSPDSLRTELVLLFLEFSFPWCVSLLEGCRVIPLLHMKNPLNLLRHVHVARHVYQGVSEYGLESDWETRCALIPSYSWDQSRAKWPTAARQATV